ncbi:uncharacterized protein LTR77_000062 [Saxophila tyrrhenica]|uniref:Uncharacterized protein n=1 Tax=Saxophila tyrrhenica TaxID=1690608 RepID=A0AAV9PLR0_9PEZI|nr:hypothetical protein LTR77_000062 [Saxophila tyrrhenica]
MSYQGQRCTGCITGSTDRQQHKLGSKFCALFYNRDNSILEGQEGLNLQNAATSDHASTTNMEYNDELDADGETDDEYERSADGGYVKKHQPRPGRLEDGQESVASDYDSERDADGETDDEDARPNSRAETSSGMLSTQSEHFNADQESDRLAWASYGRDSKVLREAAANGIPGAIERHEEIKKKRREDQADKWANTQQRAETGDQMAKDAIESRKRAQKVRDARRDKERKNARSRERNQKRKK